MNVEAIFGEFVDDWTAGRRPDVGAFLARADPAERDGLAAVIEQWLLIAPDPGFGERALADIGAEPALVAALAKAAETDAVEQPLGARVRSLREGAGLARDELAAGLAAAFGGADVGRAGSYLGRLEADELDERRVSRRLLDWLAATFGTSPTQLEPRPAAAHAWFRAGDDADRSIEAEIQILSDLALSPAPDEEMDELDRLFTGGPGG